MNNPILPEIQRLIPLPMEGLDGVPGRKPSPARRGTEGMDIADALADCTDTTVIGQAPSTLLNKEVPVS